MQEINKNAVPNLLVQNLPNREYQKTKAISRSLISALKVSVANFRRIRDQEGLFEGTSAMRRGSLVHALALTPEILEKEFFIAPKIDRRTKEGKSYDVEKEKLLQGDRERVFEEELEEAYIIASSLAKDKNFSEIMKGEIHKEPSIFYNCPLTNVRCKTRPDIWDPKRKIICEVKTSNDFLNFSKSARAYDYHIQAAMQIEGIRIACNAEIDEFYFCVVSTVAPYDVVTYKIDRETLDVGRSELQDALVIIEATENESNLRKDLETVRELSFNSFQKISPFSHLLSAYHISENVLPF